ncbi:alcohol dehydrogenase catalytic domain-containing protein [Poseidonocella sp. HB161398]|uniref:alcohol dehydrogenase catalytic domain-containing protein n=1 Tax=Poseidonocella sp. HB161398 TaxID=2320855 RepID=UPI001981BC1C|nr:alcohol dehydrogenase catalytic domain-containing protein [Poseidonocella sp. HB161398]
MDIGRRDLQPGDVHFGTLDCGSRHSGLHQPKTGSGASHFPMIPGQEITGRVTAVGSDVKSFKPGCLLGNCGTCGTCPACRRGPEQICADEGGTRCPSTPPERYLAA